MCQFITLTLTLLAAAAAAAMAPSSQPVAADGRRSRIGLPGCPTSCGNVSVPFPFGIRPGCHLPGFNLTCDDTQAPPRLLIGAGGVLQVVDISLDNATVRVRGPDIRTHREDWSFSPYEAGGTWGGRGWGLAGGGGPYVLSEAHNELVFLGCGLFAELLQAGRSDHVISSCISVCNSDASMPTQRRHGCSGQSCKKKCSGVGCCQAPIPFARTSYDVRLKTSAITGLIPSDKVPPFWVFIAEEGWFDQRGDSMSLTEAETTAIPAVLAWAVTYSTPTDHHPNITRHWNETCSKDDLGNIACHSKYSSCTNISRVFSDKPSGYTCKCWEGYQGNPYLPNGCQEINECLIPDNCYGRCTNIPGSYSCECPHGTHGDPYVPNGCVKSLTGISIGLGVGSAAVILFTILGSMFLSQKIKENRKIKLRQRFFKQNRGQLLQQLVSQRTDIAERMIITLKELEKATDNFSKARELGGGGHGTVYKGILSSLHVVAVKKSKIVVQREIDDFINEVAILSQINHRNIVKLIGCCLETQVPLLVYEFIKNGTLHNHLHVEAPVSLSWKDRLRIAVETAGALAYLHSYVSMPIIHRDIKSPNILLDDNLTVKLSDFGASRHISIDKSGVYSVVQGTFGYLDPKYYTTGHLTEKSDVYSFGMILIELLTRKEPMSYRSPQGYGLVKHFLTLLSKGNLVHILDPQVTREGAGEVVDIALLAKSCVKVEAEKRPTMRQVEMTLETIYTEFVSSHVTDNESKAADCSWENSMSAGRRANLEALGIVVHNRAQHI
ncbi:hypothetical protein ACP70R_005852 [Stipagrostis hirtigluma subsp. patula]